MMRTRQALRTANELLRSFHNGLHFEWFLPVKSNESSTEQSNVDIKLETVFCAFKQPDGTFNPILVEKRIISRRETNKPSNDKILYFHGTGERDLDLTGFKMLTITFQKINVNLGSAFDVTITGAFTVRKSGVYLFRAMVMFPREDANR